MNRDREARLVELKARIDAVHEEELRALRTQDEDAIDRAMEEQHVLMQEYRALRWADGQPST